MEEERKLYWYSVDKPHHVLVGKVDEVETVRAGKVTKGYVNFIWSTPMASHYVDLDLQVKSHSNLVSLPDVIDCER